MKKWICLTIAILALAITGCQTDDKNTGSAKSDKVSTVNIIKPDVSYGEDMVVMAEYNLQNGYSTIKFYNPKTNAEIVACGLANCTHKYVNGDEITCNALFEERVSYPFIYNDRLYYFCGMDSTALYESNVDGTDKKKIAEMDFTTDNQNALFNNGKIYLTSYSYEAGEEDAEGVSMTKSECSELYEIDIKTGKSKKLTDFGNKASVSCFAKVISNNKIYLGVQYQNKNIYDSELKTWSKYMEWLGSGINTYKENLEMFDQHCDYYCYDIKKGNIEKMEFNYDMTYEGMEDIKGYYDFIMLGVNGQFCYYLTSYADKYTLYEYDMEKDTYKELDSSHRMYYTYANDNVYITKTQYDESKEIGSGDSEDKSIPPEYRCYDTNKHKWTDIEFDYDMDQKILMIDGAGSNYVYGYFSNFTDEPVNVEDISVMALGQMMGLEIKK